MRLRAGALVGILRPVHTLIAAAAVLVGYLIGCGSFPAGDANSAR
jgi:hypothetical protein